MRRWAAILLVFLAGCSNAPVADFLDLVAPAHIRPEYNDGLEPVDNIGRLPPIEAPRDTPAIPPLGVPRPASPPGNPPPRSGDQPPPFAPGPLTVPNT
jgi:hypothetical protein